MRKKDMALAVVTLDAPHATAGLVRSSGLPPARVVVASNGSCAAANQALRDALPEASIEAVEPARGLTYCMNLGLRLPAERGWKPLPEWTILANDDVRFDTDWFERFAAAVAARPATLQVNMAYPKSSYSCVAIHRDLVRAVGWFDERFTGMFYEDDDWHLRLCEHCELPWGDRVHEQKPDGILAKIRAARHDHGFRKKDRGRYKARRALSKAANKEFFYRKWAVVERKGWCGKGLPGRFARRLPEVEWYPRDILSGAACHDSTDRYASDSPPQPVGGTQRGRDRLAVRDARG